MANTKPDLPKIYGITESELNALRAALRTVALPEGPRELLTLIHTQRQIPPAIVRQLRDILAEQAEEGEGEGPRERAAVIGKGKRRKHPRG